MGTRIAGAPISWGVSEVPGWGHQMRRERVLGEMRELGLAATEAGPDGFLPDDPGALRELLSAYDMTLASGFTPLVLHGEWRPQLEAVARPSRRRAPASSCSPRRPASPTTTRAPSSPPATGVDSYGVDEAREVAGGHGLEAALHPHYGTVVETPEEIERVLDGCAVPLCLDTGHVVLGGGDPVAIARETPERIVHLHLKDVDAELAARVVEGRLAISDAVLAGVFVPLGHGDVDARSVLESVRGAGYEGWYVFEQDTKLAAEPAEAAGPRADVARSLAFLHGALAGAAP